MIRMFEKFPLLLLCWLPTAIAYLCPVISDVPCPITNGMFNCLYPLQSLVASKKYNTSECTNGCAAYMRITPMNSQVPGSMQFHASAECAQESSCPPDSALSDQTRCFALGTLNELDMTNPNTVFKCLLTCCMTPNCTVDRLLSTYNASPNNKPGVFTGSVEVGIVVLVGVLLLIVLIILVVNCIVMRKSRKPPNLGIAYSRPELLARTSRTSYSRY